MWWRSKARATRTSSNTAGYGPRDSSGRGGAEGADAAEGNDDGVRDTLRGGRGDDTCRGGRGDDVSSCS